MQATPLISCIIPIYNTQKFLKNCIESCIHQTYKNLEIILVNDASSDNSLNIAKQYLKYPNVSLVDLKQNSGASMARNIAIDLVLNKIKFNQTKQNTYEIETNGGGGSNNRAVFGDFFYGERECAACKLCWVRAAH